MHEPRRPQGFADVARIIVDEAPDWIVDCLAHFAGMIGPEPPQFGAIGRDHIRSIAGEMLDAIDTLTEYLPGFQHLPLGLACPTEVEIALAVLPRVRELLQRTAGKPPKGRPGDFRRQLCAAVIVEAFRLVHGAAQPRSTKLLTACASYWLACGNVEIGETGDLENWRRPAEAAAANNKMSAWLARMFAAVQNAE
jgi:hypothetical protein